MNSIQRIPKNPSGSFILNERFYIGRYIDKGFYGKVYKITEVDHPEKPLVIKISQDVKIFRPEVKTMIDIGQKSDSKSKIIAYGKLYVDDIPMSFFIMPRYGQNLENFFRKNGFPS